MRKLLLLLVALVLPALAVAQTTAPPTVFTKGGTPISTTPVITVDPTGVYVSPGGAAYTGPLAAQLPTSLGTQTGANSLSVVPNSNTAFPVTDNAGSLTVDSPQLPATLGIKTSAASLSVTPASDSVYQTAAPVGGAYTDRSLASLASGSQTLMAANTSRRVLIIHNIGATAIAVNLTGGAASLTAGGSVMIVSGGSLIVTSYPPTSAITVIGTLAAAVTAYEG